MSWTHIDTAVTTVVSDGPCLLDKIIIGGGTAGAVTLYNNTSAVAEDKLLVMAPDQGSEDKLGVYEFNLPLTKGLTVVTAAATDLCVIYYRRDVDGGGV